MVKFLCCAKKLIFASANCCKEPKISQLLFRMLAYCLSGIARASSVIALFTLADICGEIRLMYQFLVGSAVLSFIRYSVEVKRDFGGHRDYICSICGISCSCGVTGYGC